MPSTRSTPFDERSQAALWASPGSFATTLLMLFIDAYGTEGLTWHPTTIQMEVEDDFRVDVPAANFDRLMTAISLLTENSFFVSLPDFVRSCVSFNGHYIPSTSMALADSADCAWGMTEAMLLAPPDTAEPFSEEIRAYVGKVLDREGIQVAPDVLRVAIRDKDLADHVRYNFSDDPEMFSAIAGMEKDKSDAINHLVKGRLRALLKQIGDLKLRSTGAERLKPLVEKMLRTLPEDGEDLPLPG